MECDYKGTHDKESTDEPSSSGTIGVHPEEKHGGLGDDGGDAPSHTSVAEEPVKHDVGAVTIPLVMALSRVNLTRQPGIEVQKEKPSAFPAEGIKSGVPGPIELNVGIDVLGQQITVIKNDDGIHMPNGLKTPTINGGVVDTHTAPVTIDKSKGNYGTIVPTSEDGILGPIHGKKEDKTGTYILQITESAPQDAKALVENTSGEEGKGPKTVTTIPDGGCTGAVVQVSGTVEVVPVDVAEHLKQCAQPGKLSRKPQLTLPKSVDTKTQTEVVCNSAHKVVRKKQEGKFPIADVVTVKCAVLDAVTCAMIEVAQTPGGHGHSEEHLAVCYTCDVKTIQTHEGMNEAQSTAIGGVSPRQPKPTSGFGFPSGLPYKKRPQEVNANGNTGTR